MRLAKLFILNFTRCPKCTKVQSASKGMNVVTALFAFFKGNVACVGIQ